MPQEVRHWSKQTNPFAALALVCTFCWIQISRFKNHFVYISKKQKIHLSLNNEKWILINFYKILVIDPGNPF